MTKPLPLLTAALALAFPLTARAEEPFADMTFKAARKAAKEQQKHILICFYSDSCLPCEVLDRTTWLQEDVQTWLKEHTVPLKIDAGKERELAAEYRVSDYPALLFIKPDGTEAGRCFGYHSPWAFLTEAERIIASDAESSAHDARVDRHENDPGRRKEYADALARSGKHKEALEEYLWCFDHGLEHRQSFIGSRAVSVLTSIRNIGSAYPPALDALYQRRDAAENAILEWMEDDHKKWKEEKPEGWYLPFRLGSMEHRAYDFTIINRALEENDRTLKLLDRLIPQGDAAAHLREQMFREVLDLLVEAKRYDDVVREAGDVFAQVDWRIRVWTTGRKHHGPTGGLKHMVIIDGGKYYEALLGVGNKKSARKLAEKLLDFEESARTYATLIRHAARAGAFDTARRHALKAESFLDEADLAEVRKAAKEVPGEI